MHFRVKSLEHIIILNELCKAKVIMPLKAQKGTKSPFYVSKSIAPIKLQDINRPLAPVSAFAYL